MKLYLIRFIAFVLQLVLRLRYRIRIEGLDTVVKEIGDHPDGVLFLPNHPAVVVDPLMVTCPLMKLGLRPMVTEYMYFNRIFYPFMRLFRAFPVPNFSMSVNPIKVQRLDKVLHEMSEGLKKGELFLIYPAGTTKHGPKEILGGSFATQKLISENPNVKIVLVRLTGLWGSRFSRAQSQGARPDMESGIKQSIIDLFKNLIFFTPRRSIRLEYTLAPSDFPRTADKLTMNKWLENWYNAPFKDGEPLKLVSYSAWKEELPEIKKEQIKTTQSSESPEEIKDPILDKLSELSMIPKAQILPSMSLIENLGLDSLNLAELLTFLETRFHVQNIAPQNLTTVAQTFEIAAGTFVKPEAEEPDWNLKGWDTPRSPERLFLPEGATIPEVFFNTADRMLSKVACSDARSGAITYRKMKRAIFLLASSIEKLPGDRIGVLLPASVGAQIIILACHVAGKTPVMINWTVGGRHLNSVIEVSGIQKVLTSWGFLDNLENVDVTAIKDMMAVLEEIKVTLPITEILATWFLSFVPTRFLMNFKRMKHLKNLHAEDEAVVLFTSGTESVPKGVPLSHYNIISNIRSALQDIELFSTDKLIGMLPPFHSFGFTVTGLMPILSGIRVAFSPNPTDANRLTKCMEQTKTTILCSAPTFLRNILKAASQSTLKNLRLLISGAEKAPDELFKLVETLSPQATLIEGYGITECSPVLTANSTAIRKNGVGKPLPNVRLTIVHPERTNEKMEVGSEGLILVAGPNIFSGYLNKDVKSPFLEMDGIRWYNTGDIGIVNENGSLTISGRLKRFIKIGGEMISLAAIEHALQENEETPECAVIAHGEENGAPKLILCSTKSHEVYELNAKLRESGFSNLIKINAIITIDELPLLGTGKIAYRELEKIVAKGAA